MIKTIKLLVPALAVVAIGCGGRSGSDSSGGGTPPTMVQMTGNHTFNPVNVTVPAGSVVQWQNSDSFRHTASSDTGQAGMNTDITFPSGVPGGSTFNWKVPAGAASGTVFFYHCEFHGAAGDGSHLGSGMAGSVTVQ